MSNASPERQLSDRQRARQPQKPSDQRMPEDFAYMTAVEMRRLIREKKASPVEIVSGCCMLCRTAALQQVHGFDSDFFLYFEDFDLSLRLGKLGDVVYLPSMRVRHGGGNAATKGGNHQRYFLRSALRFFNKNGWKLF